MWNGKNKAVTFSYDDGIEQDIRLVDIFNTYGMKCTFNLNSGLMTPESCWENKGVHIKRMTPDRLPELYKGHEIAVHCRTHPALTGLDDDAVRDHVFDVVVVRDDNFEAFALCVLDFVVGYAAAVDGKDQTRAVRGDLIDGPHVETVPFLHT